MSDWERLVTDIDRHRAAYSAFMLLSLVVFVVARRLVPRPAGLAQVPWWKRSVITVGGFIGGALGGKIPFALASAAGPLTWTAWLSDGKTITAALIGAYVGVELAKWLLEVTVKTGDSY